MVVEANRPALQAADKSKVGGTKMVLTTILDSPEIGGVKALPEISKERPTRNVGNMAGKATKKASTRRRRLIQTKLNRARKTWIGVLDHTSPGA